MAVGDEVKPLLQSLKAKGVKFEHYDMPGLSLDGDIHVGYGMQVAWFKDPDGNILTSSAAERLSRVRCASSPIF